MSNYKNQIESLYDASLLDGLPRETAIDLLHNQEKSPWYMQMLLGFCGWLASFFVMGFLFILIIDDLDSSITSALIGVTLVVGSFFVCKASKSPFVEQIGLAIGLAGLLLIWYAMLEMNWDRLLFSTSVMCVTLTLVSLIMPSNLYRFLCGFFATICFAFVLDDISLFAFYTPILLALCSILWLKEFSFGSEINRLRTVAYGFSIGLIVVKLFTTYDSLQATSDVVVLENTIDWLDEVLCCLVLFTSMYYLHKSQQLRLPSQLRLVAFTLLVSLCLLSIVANGIAMSMSFVVIAYAIKNRLLFVVGLLSVILSFSAYYYDLNMSLMNKSGVLLLLGLVSIFLARSVAKRRMPAKPISEKGTL